MFAVYAAHAAADIPLAALKIGELPKPEVPDGWVRVKVSHASLNHQSVHAARDQWAPRGHHVSHHPGQRRGRHSG